MTNTKKLDRLVNNANYYYIEENDHLKNYSNQYKIQGARVNRYKIEADEDKRLFGRQQRTHDIDLIDNIIRVENNSSNEYEIVFETVEDARKYWESNFKTKIAFR